MTQSLLRTVLAKSFAELSRNPLFMALLFHALKWHQYIDFPKKSRAILFDDNWNDYGFYTLFRLSVYSEAGKEFEIGYVKIGRVATTSTIRMTHLPDEPFFELPPTYCSLGQDPSYYENLNKLGAELRDNVLLSLRDIAADPELFQLAINEEMTKVSLLRSVSPMTVQGQFRRMSKGGALITDYNFSYQIPPLDKRQSNESTTLSFAVHALSNPPTNIHVLIGSNGVGKSSLLQGMAHALHSNQEFPAIPVSSRPRTQTGTFISADSSTGTAKFASLVSVSFSAFDDFEPIQEKQDKTEDIRYAYIGLKRIVTNQYSGRPKSTDMLSKEFAESVLACLYSSKTVIWEKILDIVGSDPLFNQANVRSLIELKEQYPKADIKNDKTIQQQIEREAIALFKKLSSGHKIVLLTITRLVETVEERTLVLIDEPEAHLHPPLLSAFIRALSELLTDRNGVAIVATHSPVVLQEVPAKCVWTLNRFGDELQAERPEAETFGENTGVLTREIFGLSVTQSGFHQLLREAVKRTSSYSELVEYFNGELGGEAKAIGRALSAIKAKG